MTLSVSGTYTATLTNEFGCDEVVTVDFTLLDATSSETAETACDSFTWNGNTYVSTGEYSWSTENVVGCDSTAVLNLTIVPSYDLPDSLSSCTPTSAAGARGGR